MYPWVCPKCGRVWGPDMSQCTPCNSATVTSTSTNAVYITGKRLSKKARKRFARQIQERWGVE